MVFQKYHHKRPNQTMPKWRELGSSKFMLKSLQKMHPKCMETLRCGLRVFLWRASRRWDHVVEHEKTKSLSHFDTSLSLGPSKQQHIQLLALYALWAWKSVKMFAQFTHVVLFVTVHRRCVQHAKLSKASRYEINSGNRTMYVARVIICRTYRLALPFRCLSENRVAQIAPAKNTRGMIKI